MNLRDESVTRRVETELIHQKAPIHDRLTRSQAKTIGFRNGRCCELRHEADAHSVIDERADDQVAGRDLMLSKGDELLRRNPRPLRFDELECRDVLKTNDADTFVNVVGGLEARAERSIKDPSVGLKNIVQCALRPPLRQVAHASATVSLFSSKRMTAVSSATASSNSAIASLTSSAGSGSSSASSSGSSRSHLKPSNL